MSLPDASNRISIFAGSKFSDPRNKVAEQEVENLAQEVLDRKLDPFYGGSSRGYMGKFAKKITDANKDIYAVRKTDPKKANQVFVQAKDESAKRKVFKEASTAVLVPGGEGSVAEFWDYLDNKVIKGDGKIGILNPGGLHKALVEELPSRIEEGLIGTKVFIEETAQALMQKLFD